MNVFRFDFKRNFGGLIGWTVVISVIIAAIMFVQTLFSGFFQPDTFSSRVDAMPSLIRGILALNSSMDLSQPYQFAAYIFQFVLLLSGIYAALIGAKALTGEEGKGTIEFLYSLPITRGSILTQKLFSGIIRYILHCIVIFAVTCATVWFLNRGMNISGVIIDLIRLFICALFTGLVYMAIGFLFSSLFRSNAESVSVTLAIVLITYIIGMMGNILSHLSFLRFFSPIHAVRPLTALNNGLSIVGLAIGLAVFIVALILARIRYKKKDFII